MMFRTLSLAAALAVTPCALAQTPSAPPPNAVNMDLAVTDAIRTMLDGAFDEGHIAMLQSLGHQKAVAAICPGFEVDPRAFANEFDLVYDEKTGKPRTLDANQRVELERKATLALGMAFGAQIAIGANDHPSFCQAASQERNGGKVTHLVWAK